VAQIRRTVFARAKQTQRVSAKVWGIEQPRIYGAAGRVILPRMTRHKHAHIGLITPSPLDHWINATLRMLAMLVLHVASTLQMLCSRTRVNATRATPTDLPRAKTDTQSQETPPAAQHRSPIALMVSSTQSVRPSNHEGVLTTPSVSHAPRAIHLPHTACGGGKQRSNAGNEGELPPPVENWGRWIAAPSRRDGGGASQAHRHLWKREPRSRLPGEALPVLSRQKRATRPSSEPLT